MKNLCIRHSIINMGFISSILLLFFWSNHALSQNYIPMLGETNEWYEWHSYVEGAETFIFYTKKDTVLNGKNYKVIGVKGRGNEYGFIREDTFDHKVYMLGYQAIDTFEITRYDFSLEENDSIELYDLNYKVIGNYFVDSVRMINTLAGPRRAIYLINRQWNFDNKLVWVEGVGSLGSIEVPFASPYHQFGLNCYFKDGIKVFESELASNYDTCMIGWSNVEDQPVTQNILVYPNPVKDILYFDFDYPSGDNFFLCVYNSAGRIIIEKEINGMDHTGIDLSRYLPGLYFYRLINLNKSQNTGGIFIRD